MTNQVRIEIQGPRATVTINRPEAMNALTPDMLTSLITELTRLGNDESIQVIVLTGAGRAFCAGVDLKSLNKITPVDGEISEQINQPGRALTELIASMPKPVIAQINGHCMTGGLEIALACDLLFASESAKLADTHAKWGIRPTWGMSQRLPRRIGMLAAKEMSYTARFVSGSEAASMGLVNAAFAADELAPHVDLICAQIISNSAAAIAAYKDLYHRTEGMQMDEGLAWEAGQKYAISDTAARLADFIRK